MSTASFLLVPTSRGDCGRVRFIVFGKSKQYPEGYEVRFEVFRGQKIWQHILVLDRICFLP